MAADLAILEKMLAALDGPAKAKRAPKPEQPAPSNRLFDPAEANRNITRRMAKLAKPDSRSFEEFGRRMGRVSDAVNAILEELSAATNDKRSNLDEHWERAFGALEKIESRLGIVEASAEPDPEQPLEEHEPETGDDQAVPLEVDDEPEEMEPEEPPAAA